MKTFSILAALLFSAQWLFAQETKSPLPLFVSGSGKIVPFYDGQLLDDGRKYVMAAIPDKDNVFTNWQPVNVYTETIYNTNGDEVVSETNVEPLPPIPGKNRVLVFTMEPEEVLFSSPYDELMVSYGWQANFLPRPQKRHHK